ncbi:MAG: PAS domain S-box protein, partial [Acidobacteriota bacterium]
ESSRDAILSTDLRGIVTTWNSAATSITGYSRDEMIGHSVSRMLPPDSGDYLEQVLARVARGEAIEIFQSDRFTRSGRPIRVDVALSPLRDVNNDVIGISAILRDITETCELQRQLQESQKMQALGQLAGGFAHDFNNLLAIVMGNLELLQSESALAPLTARRIQTAANAAVRGAGLIRHLLAFSSNEHLKPVPTNIHEDLQRIFQRATRNLPANIRIATSVDPTLPAVFVDPNSLQNALTNLVLNARDAMPAGGSLRLETTSVELGRSAPEVTSGKLAPGRYAQLLVADTGHGMTRATLARAFEPFFTTRQRARGTGLGLAAVYGFARQSSGSVHIDSEPGAGTTVSLFLPFTAESANPNPLALRTPPAQAATRSQIVHSLAAHDAKPIQNLLLVDDEGDLLHLIADFLTRVGYTIRTARSVEEALRIAAATPSLDLLITDVVFANGSNGVFLARTIQQASPAIRVLYTSGFQAQALADRGLHVDPNALLPKPYRLDQLHSAIRSLAEARTLEHVA